MSGFAARTYARVWLDRIAENYAAFRRAVGPAVEVVAVVKANAYGHGALPVARRLVAEGASWLAVAAVEEAIALREGGIHAGVLVIGGHLPFERDALVRYGLTTVAHSLDELAALDRLAEPVRFHLKIDTGMGRLGVRAAPQEIAQALASLRRARCEGLMTHFASAGDFISGQTARQLACFERVRAALAAANLRVPFAHMASTAAVAYGCRESWHNMVRAGLGLYGYVPPPAGDPPERLLDLRPALEWKARLLVVKDIPEGAAVGYDATFRTPRPMRIGVAAAGYADGVFRQLSNRGHVIAAGKRAAILGRVSMDATTIDLSHTDRLSYGDEVTLIGREGAASLDAAEVGEMAGTISYHVLCAIGSRVRRVYE
jgi:alanine racemase